MDMDAGRFFGNYMNVFNNLGAGGIDSIVKFALL